MNHDKELEDILVSFQIYDRRASGAIMPQAAQGRTLSFWQAREALQALLTKARIEEAERYMDIFEWGKGIDPYHDRIKELKAHLSTLKGEDDKETPNAD